MTTDERLWSKVARGDGCWEWTGAKNGRGYGLFFREGKWVRAHRAVWESLHGPIPEGKNLCHRCDNPPCVRPDHLFVGSQRDNMSDMDQKGRRYTPFRGQVQSGERNRNARLTGEQVAHIRGMAAAGHYHDEIAERFGVTRANVSQIARGHSWPEVEPVPYPPALRNRPVGRPRKA